MLQRKNVGNLFTYVVLSSIVMIHGASEDSQCESCPGLYCGRIIKTNESNVCSKQCGSCLRGYRTNGIICTKCEKALHLYGWLFLGFIALCVTVSHFYAINKFHSTSKKVWLLYISVLLEFCISFICMILSFEPMYKLKLWNCGVDSLKDWYTIFYNPTPSYNTKLQCTQEAVYPLYTSVFVYLLYSFISMIIFRGIIPTVIIKRSLFGRSSFYAGLYILPIAAAIHTCLAGLLYYIFPFLILFMSAIGVAVYLSVISKNQYFQRLKLPNTILILLCYCIAHGYGIISITELQSTLRDGFLLILIFLPFCFYTITRPFTDPQFICSLRL